MCTSLITLILLYKIYICHILHTKKEISVCVGLCQLCCHYLTLDAINLLRWRERERRERQRQRDNETELELENFILQGL